MLAGKLKVLVITGSQRCKEMGISGVGGSPAELAAIIQHDEPVWRKIITDSEIKLE